MIVGRCHVSASPDHFGQRARIVLRSETAFELLVLLAWVQILMLQVSSRCQIHLLALLVVECRCLSEVVFMQVVQPMLERIKSRGT